MKGGHVLLVYERPDQLPGHVRDFLLLEKLGDVSACAIDPENVKGIGDLHVSAAREPGRHRGEFSIEIEIEHSTPSMTDEEWSAKLVEKANAARAMLSFG